MPESHPQDERRRTGSPALVALLWALTSLALVAFAATWLAEVYAAEEALRPARWTVGQAAALVAVVAAAVPTIVVHRLRAASAATSSPWRAAPAPSGLGLALVATGVLGAVILPPVAVLVVAGAVVLVLRHRRARRGRPPAPDARAEGPLSA